MLSKTLLLATFLSAVSAIPANLPRAGGPSIVPIPSSCSVTSPLPTSEGSQTYKPGPSTADAAGYYAYYSLPGTAHETLYQQCLEQCYGFGGAGSGECKAAYFADNVPTPAGYYGTAGGALETGCLFYNRTLVEADFVLADAGQNTGALAGNINC